MSLIWLLASLVCLSACGLAQQARDQPKGPWTNPIQPTAKPSGIVFVDGIRFKTVQAAIDSLGGHGGVVNIPCGTFAGPTHIPSFTHLLSLCQFRPAGPLGIGNTLGINGNLAAPMYAPSESSAGTILTYRTALVLSRVWGVELNGLVLDFGDISGAGLIIQGSIGGVFDLAVQNCAGAAETSACITIESYYLSSSDWMNTAGNEFRRLFVSSIAYGQAPGGTAIALQGTGGATQTSTVDNNHFGYISTYNTEVGIRFAGADDSNHFEHVYVNVNPLVAGSGYGVEANCGSNDDEDDNGETFDTLEIDYNGTPTTGYGICIGQVTGFQVRNYEIGGKWGTHELTLSGNPVYSIYKSWDIPAIGPPGNIGSGATERVQALTLSSAPSSDCDAGIAGTFNYVAGQPGEKDKVRVCAKDAAGGYAWRRLY